MTPPPPSPTSTSRGPQILPIDPLLSVNRQLLGEVIAGPDVTFVVPPNQRPWSWTKAKVDEFFDDVVRAMTRMYREDPGGRLSPTGTGHLPHFFGTLVFDVDGRGPTDPRVVVDGQQRLTCVCLLASAMSMRLRRVIDELAPSARQVRELNGLITALGAWMIATDSHGEPIPKLTLDAMYQGFFESLVIDPISPTEREAVALGLSLNTRDGRAEHPVQARLLDGLKRMQERVDGIGPIVNAEIEASWARAINATIRNAFAVVTVETDNEIFSYKVFSWLNARGTELSEADKIKAELFDRAPPADHPAMIAEWRKMLEAAPNQDAERFIRHHHTAFVGVAELSSLHRTVTRLEIEPAARHLDLVRTWSSRAQTLHSVMTAAPGSGMPDSCRRAIIQIVDERGYSLLRPLLLAAAERFYPHDWPNFTKCVRLGLHYAFRMLTIGGEAEKQLELKIGDAARQLTLNGAHVGQIGRHLKSANPDAAFQGKFEEYGTSKTSIQFYILNEIERYLSRGGLVPADHGQTKNNIEHILPKKLSAHRTSEWPSWRDPHDVTRGDDLHRLYRNRIGNLLLLEADINSQVSDYDYDGKRLGNYPASAIRLRGGSLRKAFKDSQLRLPKKLCTSGPPTWDKSDIEAWQAELAETAVKVWTLNPSRL